MANRVKFAAILGLLALILPAACSTSPGIAPQEQAIRRARLAAISLMPDCRSAEDATGGVTDQLISCKLKTRAGLIVTAVSDRLEDGPVGLSGFLTLSVISRAGVPVAEFSEITFGEYAYPSLRDMNGDGREDLLVPLATGVQNPEYSLWIQQDSGDFARAGVFRAAGIRVHSGGLMSAARKTGDAEWETAYMRLAKGALEDVAVVKSLGNRAPRMGGRCEILSLSRDAEASQFCRN